jgi:hypothetical protein
MSRYKSTTPTTNTAGPHSNPTSIQSLISRALTLLLIFWAACSVAIPIMFFVHALPTANLVPQLFSTRICLLINLICDQREPRPDEMLPARPATQSFAAPAAGFVPPAQPSAAGLPSAIRLPPPNASGASTNSALTSGSVIPPPPPTLLPPPPSPPKRARFFVQLVKSFQANLPAPTPPLPPMPIAIDNGLPHITFNLGSNPEQDPTLCSLMDTSAAPSILATCLSIFG